MLQGRCPSSSKRPTAPFTNMTNLRATRDLQILKLRVIPQLCAVEDTKRDELTTGVEAKGRNEVQMQFLELVFNHNLFPTLIYLSIFIKSLLLQVSV